jgi:hypothetical protein
MPNAVRETLSTTPSGSIRKGAISIGLNGNLGPTGTTLFVNGITPLPGKYIIYKSIGGGFFPLIFAPQSDAELIRFANSELGGITSVSGALEEFASEVQFLAVNKAYPDIVTDKLVYLIDSTFTPSYPTSGTTTYPIMDVATVGTGALQNGVGFNSSSGAFIFDGSDDQIPLATSDNFANIDWSTGFTLMVLYKIDAITDFNSQFRCMIGVTGGGRTWNYYLYGPSSPATQLYYHFSGMGYGGFSNLLTVTTGSYHLGTFTVKPGDNYGTYYHDGVAIGTQTMPSTPYYDVAGGAQYLGRGDNMWKGNIAKTMIYNKALTPSEILQNYYQGNIITSSLLVDLDASNLSSYPGSGNTWYDISGNGNHFTLYNGVGFSTNNGGYLTFDGTNDYAASINNLNLTSYSYVAVEIFYKCSTSTTAMLFEHTADWNSNSGGFGMATNSNGADTVSNCNHTNHNTETARNYLVTNNSDWNNNLNLYSKISDSTGRLTYTNGNLTSFTATGGYATSTDTVANGSFANAIFYIGSRGGTAIPFNGQIASVKIYGFKINAQQVQQNFTAYSSFYGI